MLRVVIHSFKGGPGKSTITANVAVALAAKGKRVGVMDMDLAGPGLHVIFNLAKREMKFTLNDILLGKCPPRQAAIDLTRRLGLKKGKLIFVPAGYRTESIVNILKRGYELSSFREAIEEISQAFSLDYLLVDTQPGIEESTLLSIGLCDIMLLLSRIDKQDVFGSIVTLEVARALNKSVYLIVNMVPARADKKKLADKLEHTFNVPIMEEIPFYSDVHENLSSGVFVLQKPEHDFSNKIKSITESLMALSNRRNDKEETQIHRTAAIPSTPIAGNQ